MTTRTAPTDSPRPERDNFAPGRLRNVQMYVRSMGKLLRVRAVFGTSLDEVAAANRLMERDDRLAVVAETDGMILLADKYDQGEPHSAVES